MRSSKEKLTAKLAQQIKRRGKLVNGELVDLAAEVDGEIFLFAIVITNEQSVRDQLEEAMHDLYEYRYLNQLANTHPVILINQPPPTSQHWLIDYLENDRGIMLLWDGNDELHASPTTREKLSFLWSSLPA